MPDDKTKPSVDTLMQVRRDKLANLRAEDRDPFQANFARTHFSDAARDLFQEDCDDANQPAVAVAGRIVAFRLMGKATFLKILDQSGKIQCYVRRDEIGDEEYARFKKLDLGDFIGVEGQLFRTKAGEITVRAKGYRLVGKSMRPLPEKWHGLTDEDQIYRQRYLDLIVNEDSRHRFMQRSRIVAEIRKFLWDRSFIEVETPVLQSVPGGAAARPFTTHMNALSCDFTLRIALELYLKRMLVGGFDRVFEMGRVFRNEGVSRRHNPEFTMLELYQAYSDYRGMMKLVKDMILHLCNEVLGHTVVERYDGEKIDLANGWTEVKYKDIVCDRTNEPAWFSLTKLEKLKKAEEMGIEINPQLEDFEVTNQVFEKRIEPTLIQPTFITHLPKELIPLAKISQEDPDTIEVFELCINGQEIAPAYSEQNDPDQQRKMFEQQAGEEIQNIDQDFLEALEYGMPPAGGMGIGIDRLVILLTGASNIRETILFPPIRPEKSNREN